RSPLPMLDPPLSSTVKDSRCWALWGVLSTLDWHSTQLLPMRRGLPWSPLWQATQSPQRRTGLVRRNLQLSTQARNTIQVLWRPSALGIFRHQEGLGHGSCKLSLSPDPNFQKTAIEYPYSTTTGYGPLTAT